jgi:hypothetical protein
MEPGPRGIASAADYTGALDRQLCQRPTTSCAGGEPRGATGANGARWRAWQCVTEEATCPGPAEGTCPEHRERRRPHRHLPRSTTTGRARPAHL